MAAPAKHRRNQDPHDRLAVEVEELRAGACLFGRQAGTTSEASCAQLVGTLKRIGRELALETQTLKGRL